MHLGMTGWIHIKGDKTAYTNYYKKMKDGEADVWPPKYWKFQLETDDNPPVAAAFTDPRRFGRVRLVDCHGADIRKHSPLKENGPDPVVDVDIFTEAYLRDKMRTRHVPVKALLLDQSHISGVGNWVADEVLYQSRLHPEQYCDSFDEAEVKRLYEAVRYVCQTAVDKLGDSDEFPVDWLFNYRWGKGSKDAASELPNGEKLAFITVGGRTSCYAPGRQKKTGQVVASAKEEPVADGEAKPKAAAPKKTNKRQAKAQESEDEKPVKKARGAKGPAKAKAKANSGVKRESSPEPSEPPRPRRPRRARNRGAPRPQRNPKPQPEPRRALSRRRRWRRRQRTRVADEDPFD
ncbi:formamidopyrimidine-DNA glycosylase [Colletotrichum spaethianum]|uniref:Formamidopyrimidine-DNA glycosylase n=1 Tax=Colletotrichum spaethianum TaxID=700344 RepID=A0AA37LDG9_9PEZI|nr:formamidopyrimidine-DNA glycosylase [Colletotrichum spaethianum]GKT46393.1 formamidopyrimidine-DNA glycosylase [Colletotrichum spaethianum]